MSPIKRRITGLVLAGSLWAPAAYPATVSLAWNWSNPGGVPEPTWNLSVTHTTADTTTQSQAVLTSLPPATCQARIAAAKSTTYTAGLTWCADWPCPGAGAYTLTLHANDEPPSLQPQDTLLVGLDATCHQIAYDQALLTNVATPTLPETPATPPATPVADLPPAPAPGDAPPPVTDVPPPDLTNVPPPDIPDWGPGPAPDATPTSDSPSPTPPAAPSSSPDPAPPAADPPPDAPGTPPAPADLPATLPPPPAPPQALPEPVAPAAASFDTLLTEMQDILRAYDEAQTRITQEYEDTLQTLERQRGRRAQRQRERAYATATQALHDVYQTALTGWWDTLARMLTLWFHGGAQ